MHQHPPRVQASLDSKMGITCKIQGDRPKEVRLQKPVLKEVRLCVRWWVRPKGDQKDKIIAERTENFQKDRKIK